MKNQALLGSEFFANYPPIDLANVVAGFNFDGILPTGKTKDMTVIGYGASELEELLERQAFKRGTIY